MAAKKRADPTIGEIVRERREALGFSAQRLADLAGLHQATIWRIEAGETEPTLATRKLLAAVLGVELEVLL